MRVIAEILTIAAGVALGTFVINFGLALYRAQQMRAEVERVREAKQRAYNQMFAQAKAEDQAAREGQQG